eukprot:8540563-Heterocapsa_arctica.AAC.1
MLPLTCSSHALRAQLFVISKMSIISKMSHPLQLGPELLEGGGKGTEVWGPLALRGSMGAAS